MGALGNRNAKPVHRRARDDAALATACTAIERFCQRVVAPGA